MSKTWKAAWPAILTLLLSTVFVCGRLARYDWQPAQLAELGNHTTVEDPKGLGGYDGQYVYYVAMDPTPSRVAQQLDIPAYRYQRILYPILARMLVLGWEAAIPWSLLVLNLVVHFLGTLGLVWILQNHALSEKYALIYGLWVGLVAAVGIDLHEPLAYALVIGAWLLRSQSKKLLGNALLGLALFAKETTLIFWMAVFLEDFMGEERWEAIGSIVAAGLAFIGWQIWLWLTFGEPGIGSGGAMATPFEWIPYMGLWRIGGISIPVLGLFLVIFGPTILIPSIWGAVASVLQLKDGARKSENWALLGNSLMIWFLPFSTFREPLGLVRIAAGLVLSTILYSAEYKPKRILNYGMFSIALLAILLNQ